MNQPFPPPSEPLTRYLAPLAEHGSVRLSLADDWGTLTPLTAIDADTLGRWLEEIGTLYGGMDPKTRAAMLVGYATWQLSWGLAVLRLAGSGVPDIGAGHLGIAAEWYDEGGYRTLRFPTVIRDDGSPHARLQPDGIGRLIVAAFAPMIDMLHASTGLGHKAMWRLVADNVAVGFLTAGKAVGLVERAIAEAEAVLHAPGSPLSNRQVGFFEVQAHHPDDASQILDRQWFRARGGCCRYYKTTEAKGAVCSTCVLRTPQSMQQVLGDWLRDQALARAQA